MGRLPFNPDKMKAAETARAKPAAAPATASSTTLPGSDADPVLSVSQLADRIDRSLKAGIPTAIRVAGEVSGFRDRTHWYFDLKDADAVVSCVVFANVAKKAGFTPAIGQQILVKGRLDYYAKGGKVSFIAEKLEPVGAGALELAYRKLLEELRVMGWFSPDRKRRLPTFPRRIAVVTSRTGAALQDVLVTMRRRCPAVAVLVVDVRVQGDGAAKEITAAIRDLSARAKELGLDALLVTRGGGSMEDLWCFNDRDVAQAIVECSIPVVAAIGHETDTTIAELAADERCATPTQAAMRLTPDSAELLRQLDSLTRRMLGAALQRHRLDTQRLQSLARRPLFLNPRTLAQQPRQRLDSASRDLLSALESRVTTARHRLEQATTRLQPPQLVHARLLARLSAAEQRLHRAARNSLLAAKSTITATERQLQSVGPLRVLERGYSLTLAPDGSVLRAATQVRPGDELRTRLASGELRSRVTDADGPPTTPTTPPPSPSKRPAPKRRPDDSPGLFS